MKRYKLKKDLPTFEAGRVFVLDDGGNLYLKKETPPNFEGDIYEVMAYSNLTLKKFPNVLTDWFEEIPEEPKTIYDLQDGDECWTACTCVSPLVSEPLQATSQVWTGDCSQRSLRETGGIFLTQEECEKYIARRKAKQILLRDTKGFKPDWVNWQSLKYEVVYSYCTGVLYAVGYSSCSNHSALWFATREDAEASIRDHEKEWKIYLGVEE